jgi:uncharacterized membrane protein YdbT with pleckstrin-like domain
MPKTNHQTIESIAPDESKLYEVRKHWIGLAIVYVFVLIGYFAFAFLMLYLVPRSFTDSDPALQRTRLSMLVIFGALVTWFGLSIYTYIYRQSKIIITNRNLTQVIQTSLFSRSVAELSMSNVEDVEARHNGFLASIFNFGTLEVETAGEDENFVFPFCPRPDFYGKVVLDARQAFLEAYKPNPAVHG